MDELWKEHISDKDSLRVYSKAMQDLAIGPWAETVDGSRITWCVNACDEYSSHRLENLLLKDMRRQNHSMPTLVEQLPSSPAAVRELVDRLKNRHWKLLDVGSCYNPFAVWPQFDVTAVDIAPASEVTIVTQYHWICILVSLTSECVGV